LFSKPIILTNVTILTGVQRGSGTAAGDRYVRSVKEEIAGGVRD
jgi:hypothetical protein